jgi:hypothetical protein
MSGCGYSKRAEDIGIGDAGREFVQILIPLGIAIIINMTFTTECHENELT